MTTLTFYTHPMSRGRIVRWMLEEIGEPYETMIVEYGTTMKAPAYLAINPMGKVPALMHGQAVITETAAICTYLADAFPAAGLAPAIGDPLRGPYLRWLFFGAGPVEAAATNKAQGFDVPPEKSGPVGYGTYDTVIRVLSRQLESGPYLLGERFSAADVYLGSQIGFGLMFNTMPKQEPLVSYAARLRERPAAKRAHEIDTALMEKYPSPKLG